MGRRWCACGEAPPYLRSYRGMDILGCDRATMKVDKMSISMDPDLADEVREAARRSGRGLSSWLAEAAASRLRSEALSDLLSDFEREDGAFAARELAQARAELGYQSPPQSR